MSGDWRALYESVLARLARIDPTQTRERLLHAIDAYIEGRPIELIERGDFSRQELHNLLRRNPTMKGRLLVLNMLLTEKGIPK